MRNEVEVGERELKGKSVGVNGARAGVATSGFSQHLHNLHNVNCRLCCTYATQCKCLTSCLEATFNSTAREALSHPRRHVRQVCLHQNAQGGSIPSLPNFGAQRRCSVWQSPNISLHELTAKVILDKSLPYHEEEQPLYSDHDPGSSRGGAEGLCKIWSVSYFVVTLHVKLTRTRREGNGKAGIIDRYIILPLKYGGLD
jgi:hypothetical protein